MSDAAAAMAARSLFDTYLPGAPVTGKIQKQEIHKIRRAVNESSEIST